MNCEGGCGIRLGLVAGGGEVLELPMSGPEPEEGDPTPVHTPDRCRAIRRLRRVVEARFWEPWQVIVESRVSHLIVTVSRYTGNTGRVSASKVIPNRLWVDISDELALAAAEDAVTRLEHDLALQPAATELT